MEVYFYFNTFQYSVAFSNSIHLLYHYPQSHGFTTVDNLYAYVNTAYLSILVQYSISISSENIKKPTFYTLSKRQNIKDVMTFSGGIEDTFSDVSRGYRN